MKNMIIGVMMLYALAFPTFATSIPEHLKPTHIGNYTSEQAETLVSFLKRVSASLHEYTKETGWEACGAIGLDEQDGYSVMLFSDRVPHGCVINTINVLEGYSFTGETIHSHPYQKTLTLNAHARQWSMFYKDGHQGSRTLRNDGAGGFSRTDMSGGPGWLVAKGRLLYQSNKKVTNHGPIN